MRQRSGKRCSTRAHQHPQHHRKPNGVSCTALSSSCNSTAYQATPTLTFSKRSEALCLIQKRWSSFGRRRLYHWEAKSPVTRLHRTQKLIVEPDEALVSHLSRQQYADNFSWTEITKKLLAQPFYDKLKVLSQLRSSEKRVVLQTLRTDSWRNQTHGCLFLKYGYLTFGKMTGFQNKRNNKVASFSSTRGVEPPDPVDL